LVARLLLLTSSSVSFHSDEAIVGLMARHIVSGERPTFFYGQAYMGSLDAWLVALGFQVFGESVQTIRIVQAALYLLAVASAYYAAWCLSQRVRVAWVCAATFAVAPVSLALYSTATLGGYNETLILGHLVIALGVGVAQGQRAVLVRGFLLGLCLGLGWWANALIAVYAIPVAFYVFIRALRGHVPGAPAALLIILAGFLLGSAPWWLYALQNDWLPLRFFLPDLLGARETVGAVIPSVPFQDRLIGLFLFGLPTVVGLRFPWSSDYFLPLAGLIILAVFITALYRVLRGARKTGDGMSAEVTIIGGMMLVLCALFLLTRFSSDPSGRYFLPLSFPFGLALGLFAASIPQRALAYGVVLAVLLYNAAGQFHAARTLPGFTTQFVAQTHLANDDDQALIAWLDANDIQHGYTTYWISFRLAFLSQERLQFSAALPDKSDLAYTPAFERYPPYRNAADQAGRIAYITAQVPELDSALMAWFYEQAIRYHIERIGIFSVYHGFEPMPPRPPLPFLPSE
jgi:4-amino-4-deoxy-L-arabinose transferase-like glycosyltransferase